MPRSSSGGRTRAVIFLVASLLLAGLAAMLVVSVWRKSQLRVAEAERPKETVEVIVAIRELYMGLPITPDDVVVRDMLPEMVPPEVRDVTYAKLEDILGRTPRERILMNEVIRKERLADPNAGIGLNAIITPGRRAMTIATNTETAVAGLVQAGNFIDVIVTIKPDDPSLVGAKWVTQTILQEIKVLAVGSSLKGAESHTSAVDEKGKPLPTRKSAADPSKRSLKPSITLEVTPEEAESLAMATSRGEIMVVLRSDIDSLQIDSHGLVTAQTLIGFTPGAEAPAPNPNPIPRRTEPVAAAKPEQPKAEVISGGSKIDVTFEADGTTTESKGAKSPGRKK